MENKRIKFRADWNDVWSVFVIPTMTLDIYTSLLNEKKFSVDIIFLKFNIGFEILLKNKSYGK